VSASAAGQQKEIAQNLKWNHSFPPYTRRGAERNTQKKPQVSKRASGNSDTREGGEEKKFFFFFSKASETDAFFIFGKSRLSRIGIQFLK
jgi:hypothetical protein